VQFSYQPSLAATRSKTPPYRLSANESQRVAGATLLQALET
jgi:hypothetical protein